MIISCCFLNSSCENTTCYGFSKFSFFDFHSSPAGD